MSADVLVRDDAAGLTGAMAGAAAATEVALAELIGESTGLEGRLIDAMRYATLNGGKRLRGFLVLEAAGLFGVPQAWAAGSVFSLVQAMTGYQPDAPNRRVLIDPTLPDWLPDLTLRGLRVGNDVFDLRFARNGDVTETEVLRGDPARVVRQEMSAWPAA